MALLSVDTHLLRTFWNVPRFPLVGFAFQEEKASCFRATDSPQDSVYHEQDASVHERKRRVLWKNSQAELTSGAVDMGD